jgi:hypothetical protein
MVKAVDQMADWIRGDNAFLYKNVPAEVGEKHVTELMGRHPFHPYDPALPAASPCTAKNAAFFRCMSFVPEPANPEVLHQTHVRCFHPFKVDLMKCLVSEKQAARAAAAAAAEEQGQQ